jgi:hypothetical protein
MNVAMPGFFSKNRCNISQLIASNSLFASICSSSRERERILLSFGDISLAPGHFVVSQKRREIGGFAE